MTSPAGGADPFGTAALRDAALETWRRDPSRLRQDANLEEDFARGAYSDRLLVELAQNAADAARAAGEPGRVLMRLTAPGPDSPGGELLVANTGAPLTAEGVAALASLRASAKRADGGVGRFGVGFSAVRAVSADIAVATRLHDAPVRQGTASSRPRAGIGRDGPQTSDSASGRAPGAAPPHAPDVAGIRFSLDLTRAALEAAVAEVPALRAEVDRRQDSLPVLRLPFPDPEPEVPEGYTTVVRLRLPATRPGEATMDGVVEAKLSMLDDDLLLALADLAEIRVELPGREPHVLRDVAGRWRIARATGTASPELLADRPVEDRERTGWSVTWAIPRPGAGGLLAAGLGGAPLTALMGDARFDGAHAPATPIHAPTPTGERSSLPALLIATLPLDRDRHRVMPGALTDHLVDRAGEVYASLAADLAAEGEDALALVPTRLPAGELDAALHAAVTAALRETPLLAEVSADHLGPGPAPRPPQDDGPEGRRPVPEPRAPAEGQPEPQGRGRLLTAREAQAIDGEVGRDIAVLAALAPLVAGLVSLPPERVAQARTLGVALRDLPEVVEDLPAAADPAAWRRLYDALAPHALTHREALTALPVPLQDGRVVRGPRGLLLPTTAVAALAADRVAGEPGAAARPPGPPDDEPERPQTERSSGLGTLSGLGIRLVHPEAAHPLLASLGAREADARALLDQPALEAAALDPAALDAAALGQEAPSVTSAATSRAGASVTAVVLDLARQAVAENGPGVTLPAWLESLPLPTADGGSAPAGTLLVPGSWAEGVLDLDPVHPDVVHRWGEEAMAALGVRTGIVTTTVPDVVAEPLAADDEAPEGWPDYLEQLAEDLGPGAWVGDLPAVSDLDVVLDEAWPVFLRGLAEDPAARAALLAPVRAVGGGQTPAAAAPSYTAWWLREELDAPFAHPRRGAGLPFLPEPPAALAELDDEILDALGAVGGPSGLAALGSAGWDAYLDHWPDDGEIPLPGALALWRALAGAAATGLRITPPDAVPTLDGERARMLPAEDVVVATPMWAQVRPVVPAPAAVVEPLADLLDLDVPVETVPRAEDARPARTPEEALAVLPEAPGRWLECARIVVEGRGVDWWVHGGTVYATTTAGLARGLAHAAGSWPARHVLEAVLADPSALPALLAEHAGDDADVPYVQTPMSLTST